MTDQVQQEPHEDEPHIEIIVDRHHYRVYMSGRIEGFPENAIVINRMLPVFDKLFAATQAALNRLRSGL